MIKVAQDQGDFFGFAPVFANVESTAVPTLNRYFSDTLYQFANR